MLPLDTFLGFPMDTPEERLLVVQIIAGVVVALFVTALWIYGILDEHDRDNKRR